MISRKQKEQLLNQKGKVVWFTGLSGSGKSTIAVAIEKELFKKGYSVQLLDGDNIRSGISKNLGFSREDRKENIRRVAEVALLFKTSGIITLCSFISPTAEIRALAREIIGEGDFIEVFVNTPLVVCEERDPKSLYKKARIGEVQAFTGISSAYETPQKPQLILDGTAPVEHNVQRTINHLLTN